jgi:hypothetical protein
MPIPKGERAAKGIYPPITQICADSLGKGICANQRNLWTNPLLPAHAIAKVQTGCNRDLSADYADSRRFHNGIGVDQRNLRMKRI